MKIYTKGKTKILNPQFGSKQVKKRKIPFKLLIVNNWMLFVILMISLFFRFYNFKELQFWNADDEVITAVIRHIIWDRSPTLIVPNSFLGFGLGPFFHFMLTPIYFVTNFNLILIQAFASILGVITTLVVYKSGQALGGKMVGLLASFFYSSSFLISFFDRRIWPLTLDGFLAAFTFWLLTKIVRGNYKYIPLLAVPVGFSFHSDPSLITLDIAIFLAFIIFRLPIRNKWFALAIVVLGIFVLPLIGAEIRYNRAVSGPVIKALTRPLRSVGIAPNFESVSPIEYINVLSRFLAVAPSKKVDQNYCHSCPQGYEAPLFTPFIQIIVLATFAGSLILLARRKNRYALETQIMWLMIFSFILGLTIYNRVFKGNASQNYFSVIAPIFVLMVSQVVFYIHKNYRALSLSIILIFFIVNLNALFGSTVEYPLYRKIDLVKKSAELVGGKPFSINASGGDIITGGWTELFVTRGFIPTDSYWYGYLDWIYQAYSLYPGPLKTREPERIVWFTRTNYQPDLKLPIVSILSYKDLRVYIFNNNPDGKDE